MSVIDEDGGRDYVIPKWDFEHSMILHLVDVLNEHASICVYENIIYSFSKKLERRPIASSHGAIYIPFKLEVKVPLVRDLLVHHKENGMRYMDMADKYGISVRHVQRLIKPVEGDL